MQLGPGGPTRADIQASLVREYAEFGASHPQGLTLILDDYHAVDGSDEVVPTVRALIEQTGPGFSIVIASRSTPRLPLGRLRARGAVSRIGGDALCFDVPETDRLFRDAYHLPIEPDVVDELVERTEGWAALLSLVNVDLGEQVAARCTSPCLALQRQSGRSVRLSGRGGRGRSGPRGRHSFLTRVVRSSPGSTPQCATRMRTGAYGDIGGDQRC